MASSANPHAVQVQPRSDYCRIGDGLAGQPALNPDESRQDEFQVATVMVTHDTEFVPLTDAVASMRDGALTAAVPVRSQELRDVAVAAMQ